MQWRFGPFRLDLAQACLWHGAQRVPLRPKTFDLLVYLVRHAGALVSREALLEAVQLLAVYEGRGLVLMRLTKIAEALGDIHTVLTLARTAGNQQKEGESLCHLALAHSIMRQRVSLCLSGSAFA